MNKTSSAQQVKTSSFLPQAQGILQRKCACGNHTVAGGVCAECAKSKNGLQRKLIIGASNDLLELEADRIAGQVMAEPAHSAVSSAVPRIQRYTGQAIEEANTTPATVDQTLASPGESLEPALRQDMEQRFGYDFSEVRVHTGTTAEQSARELNAHAFTVGHHIVFGRGQYSPRTIAGQHLLAHELAHTIQQSGNPLPTLCDTSQVLWRTSPTIIQRRETGSGLDDPLYMADRRWSSGQGPDDRITGQRLQNWAIARGSFVIRDDASLMRMQEQDGVESEIVDEILILLIDLLRGHDPRDPNAPEHIQAGPEVSLRPASAPTRLDKFEGSDNARERAVLELVDHWGPIKSYLTHVLVVRYRDSYFEASGRTPKDMSLETDTEVIKRIRNNPYRHEHQIPQGLVGNIVFKVGQRWGHSHIVDIYKFLGSRSESGGTVWAYLDGYPLWYYSGSLDLLNRQVVIGEVTRTAAESAKFAAQIFPLLIKAGGFVLSFSPNPLIMIAGVVLDELGEEGLRDLSGEGRSFKDIASSAGREILVNLVIGKLMGGGGEGKAASEAAEALDKVAEKAATRIRASVEKEIARTEGPQLVKAVKAGEVRGVTDKALVDEGFVYEMHIKHEGGSHIYRRKLNGELCRWSIHRICDLEALEEELKELGGFPKVPGATFPVPTTGRAGSRRASSASRAQREAAETEGRAAVSRAGPWRGRPTIQAGNLEEGWIHIEGRHVTGNHPQGAGDLFAHGTTRTQLQGAAEVIVERGVRISAPHRRIQTFERRITINGQSDRVRVVVDTADGRIITMFPVREGG